MHEVRPNRGVFGFERIKGLKTVRSTRALRFFLVNHVGTDSRIGLIGHYAGRLLRLRIGHKRIVDRSAKWEAAIDNAIVSH
jgi:hypothetical protein